MRRVLPTSANGGGGRVVAREFQMIVQLPLASRWGNEAEMAARDALADALAEGFGANGFGHFDGTDVGMGKTNLFIYSIPPDRWEAALAFTVSELQRRGLAETALVARGLMATDEDEDDPEEEVVWPVGYQGRFSIF
jgi:hypothetical protein